jgi:crotonobetainyl-CoA:carnitine CoA-transferase CaiB-like acyl-CoA transferase
MRDLRVVELAGSVAGAYCGRLFATAGADVVLVEPPDGAPLRGVGPMLPTVDGAAPRSAMHEHLDAGKRSVTVDLEGPDGDATLAWADVVILSVNGDADSAFALQQRIRALNPRTVLVALSGFGLTGPYSTWRASDLIDWASGGFLFLSGEPGREPLQGGGPWVSLLHGATAGVGAATAVLDATLTGQGQLVDVGNMEAISGAHQWSLTMYTHTGVIKQRAGLRFENFHPLGLYRCSDSRWIIIAAPSRDQFEQVCITCEAYDLLLDDALIAPSARFERADEIDAQLQPWLSAHTAEEAVAALQANRVPAGMVNTYLDVLASEQLALRGEWAPRPDVAPGARMPKAPFHLEPGPDQHTGEPPHALGADTAAFLREAHDVPARRAFPAIDLTTVRVAEFSIAWAGPLTGRFMADFGAQVTKVEHPGSRGVATEGRTRIVNGAPGWKWGMPVDPQIRSEIFPNAVPGERFWNRTGVWNKMNRGKRSLALEAKEPAGKVILDQVLAKADVVLHNFSPRGAASLGIDAAAVAPLNPTAITVAMTGYGETGPMSTHFSFGPMLEGFCGLNEATGYIGEGPLRLGYAFPDAVGGLHGTFAVLAALWERAATKAAVHLDLSQLETLASFVGDGLLLTSATGQPAVRHGNRSIDVAPQGVYRCDGDDRWLAITVDSDVAWQTLVDIVGDPDLIALRGAGVAERFAAHDAIDAAIGRWTGERVALSMASQLQAAGVIACPAFNTADLVDNEQLHARGFMIEWDQVDVGVAKFPGFPIHFEHRTYEIVGAPALGGHNAETLRDLGYTDAQIDQLTADGVITDHPPV